MRLPTMRISHLALVLLVLACIGGSSAYNSTLGWQTLNSGIEFRTIDCSWTDGHSKVLSKMVRNTNRSLAPCGGPQTNNGSAVSVVACNTETAPIVIANGGSSGIYPDQTSTSYNDAVNSTALPLGLLCDLQLTKDNQGICRQGWNLSETTNITIILTNTTVQSTYVIQGQALTGYFSVDYTSKQLQNLTAIQHTNSRSPYFDGMDYVISPEAAIYPIIPGRGLYFWLNIEYPSFYQSHPAKNSLSNYLTGFLRMYYPDYLSATEVNILRLLAPTAAKSHTVLIFKVLDLDMVEESTNATYGHIMSNLTYIATFAHGILVPKELVYSVDNSTEYLRPATTLVQDAHAANLTVFVYGFANDNYPSSYNYSYDSVREYLGYMGDNFTVDGFVTDFPTTAAEAIHCYPDGYKLAAPRTAATSTAKAQPTVISHNGASGDFPGCTLSAYTAAVDEGADYIDCTVQITSDGILICREDPDLVKSTNVFSNQVLYQTYVTTYSELQVAQGVFTFDVSWANISTLNATIYSPWQKAYNDTRDPANNDKEKIMTLDEFLAFAKNTSGVGIYINIQNAYYLRTQHSLDVVDGVVTSLKAANLTNADDKILVASEDSSALSALSSAIPAVKLVYDVKYADPISVDQTVLQEIKKYASIIALDHHLVDPLADDTYFLTKKTSTVSLAHSLNMTVFYYFLSNEFNAYAIDYRSDPILQINSVILNYNVDGFITDFPATLYNFLHNNYCYQPLGSNKVIDISTGMPNYGIYPVTPGAITLLSTIGQGADSIAPSPSLVVDEPLISYLVPLASPSPLGVAGGSSSPPPSPLSARSASSRTSVNSLVIPIVLVFVILCVMN